ncbi:MAG: hypothetical protein FWH17_10790 [Oscillospiraceae bacterium]|nr:hypothetical protein [Oscillospiraceae bacterium]
MATKKPPILIILIVVAVVAAAAVGAYFLFFSGGGGFSSPDALIESYFKAAVEEDYEAIYDLFLPRMTEILSVQTVYGDLSKRDIVRQLDSESGRYGDKIERWEIDRDSHRVFDTSDLRDLNAYLNINISEYFRIDADVWYTSGSSTYIVFEIVQVDGKYYTVDIW